MKYFNLNSKTFLALVVITVLGFTACLKKTGLNTNPATGTGTNNVVEFFDAQRQSSFTSVYPQYDYSLGLTGDTSGFFVNIDYAGAMENAPQDITVTLALNAAALTTFNTSEGTDLKVPDASIFSFPTTVVIAKGTNRTQTRVTIKASAAYDYTASYALPLFIAASSYGVISTNYNIAIYSFIVKNQYEGSYTSTGYFFHPSIPRGINATYSITTAGQNTCKFPIGDFGGSNYFYNADIPVGGGALTNYVAEGSAPTGDGSGFMTTDNPSNTPFAAALPNATGAGNWLSSTYNNSYVAASKTFLVHVGYGGTSGQNSWSRQIYQKFVKQ